MAFIEERVTRLKTHLLKAITQSKSPSNELHYIAWMNCDNPFNAYALGRAEQQLIHEGKILLDPDDYTLRLVDTHGPGMVVTHMFPCPYCDFTSTIIKGLDQHVIDEHPIKQPQFLKEHRPDIVERFKELQS